jgi:ribosomal-protein-alanine acetyltransferase
MMFLSLPNAMVNAFEILDIDEFFFSNELLTQKQLLMLLNSDTAEIMVAVEMQQVVGFLYCELITSAASADVMKLAVHPLYQQQKIATNLLLTMQKKLQQLDISKLLLEVRTSNAPAINFYRRNNFIEIGKRNNFYHKPLEDALLFEKKLK